MSPPVPTDMAFPPPPRVETVTGGRKTPEQVRALVEALLARSGSAVFVRGATQEQHRAVLDAVPTATYHPRPSLIVVRAAEGTGGGRIGVVAAGTSDLPVAEEAAEVAEALGLRVERLTDVGVAGLHRLLAHRSLLEGLHCVIVAAGMEGALPSAVAGLVTAPVIAVPTSVGYGTSFGGIAALLAMLSSSAPGVAVVGIDNGLAAAVLARRIVRP